MSLLRGHITRRALIDAIAGNRTRKEQARALGLTDGTRNSTIRKIMRRNDIASKALPCGVTLIITKGTK